MNVTGMIESVTASENTALSYFFDELETEAEGNALKCRVCESFSVNRILRSSMIKYQIIGGLVLWQEKRNQYTKYK